MHQRTEPPVHDLSDASLGLLESAPDPHLVVVRDGGIVAANRTARALLTRLPSLRHMLQEPLPPVLEIVDGPRPGLFSVATSPIAWDGSVASLCRIAPVTPLAPPADYLESSVALIHEILDAIGDSIVVLDEHGTIVSANAQWRISARANGLTLPDDGVGANYLAVCDAAAEAGTPGAERVARGLRDVLAHRAVSFSSEYPMDTAQRPRNYRMVAYALHEARGAVVLHSDVSAIHEEQRARIEALAHFQATFEDALDAMLLVDDGGRILEANGAAAVLLGRASRGLVGHDIAEVLPPAALAPPITLASLLSPAANRGLLRVAGPDGRALDLEYAARAAVLPGRNLLVLRDVTDLHRLEGELRQAQKMEAVGQLTGGIAHDFNNILTVVLGNAELLLHGDARQALTAEDISSLEDIVSTAGRGADTVRKLMAFARKEPLRPTRQAVGPMLRDLSRLLSRVLPESIALTVHAPDDLPAIRVDSSALQQMLLNLCTNARDAIGDAGGAIAIRAQIVPGEAEPEASPPDASRSQHLTITVSDDGAGMDADVLAHMFEPFFTTKEVGKGTGLGMSMVYGLTAQHGGRVTVESVRGRGTAVSLHFPLAEEAPAPRKEAVADLTRRSGDARRILLVEDNPAIRRVALQVLTRAGYRVQLASSGSEGVEAFRTATEPFDLVISDVVMPNGGGRAVADAVAQHLPPVPVVWITGYAADGVPSAPAHYPMAWRTVQKPWTVGELLAAVRDALPPSGTVPPPSPAGVTQ